MATQDLASAASAEAAKTNTSLRMGTVTAVSAAGVTVSINGASVGPLPVLGSYGPAQGDVVAILRQDSSWLVLGTSGGASGLGVANVNSVGSSQVIGTSNGVILNTSGTFTKKQNGTRVLLRVMGTAYSSTGTGYQLIYGVNIDSIGDQDIGRYNFNVASDHRSFGAEKIVTGVGVGSHAFHAFGRCSTTGVAVSVDGGDWWSVTLQEVA